MRSKDIFFTLRFRIDGKPIYKIGEKYCSRCRIVHPTDYPGDWCFFCHNNLRKKARETRLRKRARMVRVEEVGEHV